MSKQAQKQEFRPPKSVQKALQRGLDLKDDYAGKGLRAQTVAWARHFVAGKPSSLAQARKMRAWFRRHKVDRRAGWDDPPTPGYVAWLLWGGEAGQKWAEKLVAQQEAGPKKAIKPARAKKTSGRKVGAARKKKAAKKKVARKKKAGRKKARTRS